MVESGKVATGCSVQYLVWIQGMDWGDSSLYAENRIRRGGCLCGNGLGKAPWVSLDASYDLMKDMMCL